MIRFIKEKIGSTERSAIINMILKPVSAVLGLVYTPMLLNYLGDEKYGLWATILSIITWINFFDVGIGNGLRNVLSKILVEGKKIEAKKAVSTAYIILTIISIILLIILVCIAIFINWNVIFSTTISMKIVMLITFIFICINFVLSLSNTMLYALHQAEKVSIRNCFVQIANIFLIFIISRFTYENLIAMAIIFGGTNTIFYVESSIHVFKKNKYLIPSIRLFDKAMIKDICSIGIRFFIIQIMGLLLFTVDNMLITHYFGATVATPFTITNKIFNTIYSAFAAFIVPYWSKTTVAVSKKNISWIKCSIKKVTFVAGIFICFYIFMGIIFSPVMKIWLHKELLFQSGLVSIMVLFYSLYTLLGVECQFINGIGKIETQLVIYIIIGTINVPLSIFLGVYVGLGCVGIRLATTILVAIAVMVLAVNLRKTIKELELNNFENI